jgi:hypothetical protein
MIAGKYTDINFIKKNNVLISVISIEDYNNVLFSKCEKTMPTSKKLEKINNDNLCLPTVENSDVLFKYNYNVQQLKQFAKQYKLKVSGNKNELLCRIYVFLNLSKTIVHVQKIFRGFLQRNYCSFFGPAFKNKELCNNHIDFFTMDDFANLKWNEFFSYKDDDGFIYGFNVVSFYNLIKSANHSDLLNPYNRNKIPQLTINRMKKIFEYNKIFNIKLDINIEEKHLSQFKSIDTRAFELFRNIDYLGNYTNHQWFLSLNVYKLYKFIREINEVWTFRLNIPPEVKRNIYPPHGDLFRNIRICLNGSVNGDVFNILRGQVLDIMERLVNSGTDTDSRSLGSCYVLGALTLVSDDAALAMPWLYQSFSYF